MQCGTVSCFLRQFGIRKSSKKYSTSISVQLMVIMSPCNKEMRTEKIF